MKMPKQMINSNNDNNNIVFIIMYYVRISSSLSSEIGVVNKSILTSFITLLS